MTTGTGIFYDGSTSIRHDVTVEAAPEGLKIADRTSQPIALWPYRDLRAQSAPDSLMRLRLAGGPELARLEVRDPVLIAEIDRLADSLDRTGQTERRLRTKVIGWTLGAAVSLTLVAVFGVPALSDRIAPLIPLSVEQRLGNAMDAQVRSMLDNRSNTRAFECGTDDAEKDGRAALEDLIGRMQTASGLPIPLKAAVVRRSEANAIALPGGHIYVFEGLIKQSHTPDELAGVVAHEIGHVAHRDGTRSLLQAAGLSFLFGVLLGDFTGGGLVVIAARTVVQTAYSRDAETSADLFSVRLMTALGGDPRALAAILGRIASKTEPDSKILADHPLTKDRVTVIEAASGPARRTAPVLQTDQWAALKRICG